MLPSSSRQGERGFDLLVTSNGVDFDVITRDGFGDPYNHGLRVFGVTDEGLCIGTANPFYGTQVWKLIDHNKKVEEPISIEYRTHMQNEGWQPYAADGAMSGTSGKGLRLEGIKIRLTGDLANTYSVEYRTHVQNDGWQKWVKDDAMSGTKGKGLRLEGI
ncbi:MAG: hypothetical protein ACI4EL_04265 [Candidatus Fimimorpha sp.]